MKLILLQYPDEASTNKILDDLTQLNKGIGQPGHRAAIAFDHEDTALEGLATKLQQRGITTTASTGGEGLPSDQAIVEDGTPIAITGGDVTFTVVDNEITGGTFVGD